MSLIDNIEDETLKTEVVRLNLTVPDPNSVLDPSLETFHPQLYYKLACMEAYTYQNSQQDVGQPKPTSVEYAPFWLPFNDALLGYANHAPLPKQKLKDFLIGFFCFMSVHVGRGEGPASLIPASDAKLVFNMSGYYETIVQPWTLDHFDDFVAADPVAMPEPTVESAEKLTEAPAAVEPLWGTDAAKVDALIAQYADIVSDVGVKTAFSNPTAPQGSLSPTEVWDLIFVDLNWKWYIENSGSTVTIPERPEPLT